MEAQTLHQILGLAHQLLEGLVGILGAGILEHFHLVELVTAHHAPFVGAVRTCLPAEAGGVSKELLGQVSLGENLIAVHGSQRSLGSGEHIVNPVVGGVGNLIYFIGKLGELAGGFAALILQHMRGQDEIIAIGNVGVNEVVQQRPLQPCAHAGVHPVAGTCQLHTPLIVDKPQILAQIHMVLGREVKLVGLAKVAQGFVVFLSAGLQVGVGQVGQRKHTGAVLGQNGIQLGCILCQFGLQLCHFRKQGSHVLALLLHLGNFLGNLVLHGLALLGGGNQLPTLLVQLQNAVNGGIAVHFLGTETCLHRLGIFLDFFNVQHNNLTPFVSTFLILWPPRCPLWGKCRRSDKGGVVRILQRTPSVSPFGLTAPPKVEPRALRAANTLFVQGH